jgi:hypothetical protein
MILFRRSFLLTCTSPFRTCFSPGMHDDVINAVAGVAVTALFFAVQEVPIVMPFAASKTSGVISDPEMMQNFRPAPAPPAEQQATPAIGATSPQPLTAAERQANVDRLNAQPANPPDRRCEPWRAYYTVREDNYSIWDPRWSPPRGW